VRNYTNDGGSRQGPPEDDDIPFVVGPEDGDLDVSVQPSFAEMGEPFRVPPQNAEQWGFKLGFLAAVQGTLKHLRKRIVTAEQRLAVRDSVATAEISRLIRCLKDDADEVESDLAALLAEAKAVVASARRNSLRLIDGGKASWRHHV
jgi:hypothetical protein